MSIYKEPPPGMFVVPDTVDMTKVRNSKRVGGYREPGPRKLEEPKKMIHLTPLFTLTNKSRSQESLWLAQGHTVRWGRALNRCLLCGGQQVWVAWKIRVYASGPSLTIIRTLFHSQKCSSLDDKLYDPPPHSF